MRPIRVEPAAGQESVWDYPRPPIAVPTDDRIRVMHAGVVIVDTRGAVRVLETSQPPAYYVPRRDVALDHLQPTRSRSMCEWKGAASYWSIVCGGQRAVDAAWSYEHPMPAFEGIAGHLAFYAQRVDECWVNDEQVIPNPGSFYGGWITSRVVGPFKGDPGTLSW